MELIVLETAGMELADISPYFAFVTKERQAVVLRKKSPEDKLLALASELLVLSELSRRTGIPVKRIRFVRGAHGKPYVKGGGVEFSLSHTKGAVCVAFSENDEIGVDIERADRKVREGLFERALCDEERSVVHTSEEFIGVWVKKEAFLKRLGIGISKGLKSVNTLILPETCSQKFGEYIVGISGKDADNAQITTLSVKELLARFD